MTAHSDKGDSCDTEPTTTHRTAVGPEPRGGMTQQGMPKSKLLALGTRTRNSSSRPFWWHYLSPSGCLAAARILRSHQVLAKPTQSRRGHQMPRPRQVSLLPMPRQVSLLPMPKLARALLPRPRQVSLLPRPKPVLLLRRSDSPQSRLLPRLLRLRLQQQPGRSRSGTRCGPPRATSITRGSRAPG